MRHIAAGPDDAPKSGGALAGVRVVELAGIGPAPFGTMMLADMGAEVIRVDRCDQVPDAPMDGPFPNLIARGRRSVGIDLKHPDGAALLLDLLDTADVFIEPFRPGVVERLGIGPEEALARNPRLVYARMSGWGREGQLAARAGHDINYIAMSGALFHIGPPDQPPLPPLALVGDFGGGGMSLAFGIVCALFERTGSGKGQVVDASVLGGSAALMTSFVGRMATGEFSRERYTHWIQGPAHWYCCYRTADGGYISVGALEPQFYAVLLERLELSPEKWPQHDRAEWPRLRREMASIFAARTRAEWVEHFDGVDACVAPVLPLDEAMEHEHLTATGAYVTVDGVTQPGPAPRLGRTAGAIAGLPPWPGQDTRPVLAELGLSGQQIDRLESVGAIRALTGTTRRSA
ncbi:CaiB/BaiF CoA transferase family protein [Nocardia xishanensis]|uniref:CaiB/BaiF CoA transferase family protein n=1 Tax=Nocardia xishanensis TaxID=238964 RepID=A0ABW7XC32_9NOCA